MAINLYCPHCLKTSKLETVTCQCGNNLKKSSKYRTRFKLSTGKWKSKVVDTLDLAKSIEAKYRVDNVKADQFGMHEVPKIDDIWKKYIKWAENNKRPWQDDKTRWERHIAPHVKARRMNKVTPRNIEATLNIMRDQKYIRAKAKRQSHTLLPLLNRYLSLSEGFITGQSRKNCITA